MLPRLIVVAAAALVVLPYAVPGSVAPASASPAVATANSVTFQDSTGELPNAPDITTVVVSNNDGGLVSFKVNGPPRLVDGMLVEILVDSDNNPATGDPESLGADYAVELFRGSANLFRWDGTSFSRRANDPPQATLVFSDLTIRINASELGNASQLNFGVTIITGITVDSNGDPDFSQAAFDAAPDVGHGYWAYNVRIAPVRLLAKRFSLAPRRPQSGRTLTANLVATRSDTGATLTGGRVVCAATVGGRRVAVRTRRFVGTQARCTWQIPSSARGKQIRGSIAVVFEGRRVTRSFSATVG